MRPFPTAVVLLSAGLSTALFAQTVTVGELPPNPNFGFTQVPMTAIDLSHPAPVAATLTNAAFTWSAGLRGVPGGHTARRERHDHGPGRVRERDRLRRDCRQPDERPEPAARPTRSVGGPGS